ncbi:MAG: hypothetical protein IKS13_04215 [Ruminococcus sp.]|nr:hypothetical protein [Ruminococcus sp.]MBR6394001.1 hypothetical protein [Ruminococcus sp.]
MTDEMKKNLENEELDLEQIEGISGGLIVDPGGINNYRIVDDKTGEILDSRRWFKEDAIGLADDLNVSNKIISMAEYKKRFGKDLDMDIWIDAKTGRKK